MQSPFLRINRLLLNISNTLLGEAWNCKISEVSRIYTNLRRQPYSSVCSPFNMSEGGVGLSLKDVLDKLITIAPLSLAESWDNVGLLVEPSTPKLIKRVFVTNDLTEWVLEEALTAQSDFIISYHPPIFLPLKSLTTKVWKERVIVKCIENKVAVFSPHSSYDSVQGGVTDWMASVFGPDCNVVPLVPAKEDRHSFSVQAVFPNTPQGNVAADNFVKKVRQHRREKGAVREEEFAGDMREVSEREVKLKISSNSLKLLSIARIFHEVRNGTKDETLRILKYEQIPIPYCGSGRLCTLKQPITVGNVVNLVKKHIHLAQLRLALVPGKNKEAPVSTVAICVGSGTSVLRGVKADLFLTGEMLHHDVLDAVHNGTHVILCNHSDSERGFLTVLAVKLNNLFQGSVKVIVSKEDRDPLSTV